MRHQKGFSLIEMLVVMAILLIITSMMFPLFKSAILRAQVGAMASDAKAIQMGFKRFYIDNDMYPNASDDPAFQLDTFEPLVSEGYYDGRVAGKLEKLLVRNRCPALRLERTVR